MEQQLLLGHVDGRASRLVKREYLKADLLQGELYTLDAFAGDFNEFEQKLH